MREPDMFEPMKMLLESKGYKIIDTREGKKSGADIIAEYRGRKLIMEMKGDSAALDVDLGTGIFQLLRHMYEGCNEEYALGISGTYTRIVKQIEYPLKKLGIRVFVIDDNPHQLW